MAVVVQSHSFKFQKNLLRIKLGNEKVTNNSADSDKLDSNALQFALLRHARGRKGVNGGRRGKMDIFAEILLFCEQQKTKTSIMYNTNLNYSQLKNHVNTLTAQGLLAKKVNRYTTTEKGYRFLVLFAQLNDLMKDFS